MTLRHFFLTQVLVFLTVSANAAPKNETIDLAIAKGDLADVQAHLAQNPESARKGGKPSSRAPLEQAILRKKTEIALLLIKSGADTKSCNASKSTPLHLAVERNLPTVAKALIDAGVKTDVLGKKGWTPLHHAAAKNQLETAKVLIAGGAKPMTLSERGGTPLHEAACSGGKKIIQFLLSQKIDPSIVSKNGVTALDLARNDYLFALCNQAMPVSRGHPLGGPGKLFGKIGRITAGLLVKCLGLSHNFTGPFEHDLKLGWVKIHVGNGRKERLYNKDINVPVTRAELPGPVRVH